MLNPCEQLVSPRVLEGRRRDDQDRPVSLEQVCYRDGLNSLSYSHLISQDHPSEVVNSVLHSYLLEVIERMVQAQHRSVKYILLVVIANYVLFGLIRERHRVFQYVERHLSDGVEVNKLYSAELRDFTGHFLVLVQTYDPLSSVEVKGASVPLENLDDLFGHEEVLGDREPVD